MKAPKIILILVSTLFLAGSSCGGRHFLDPKPGEPTSINENPDQKLDPAGQKKPATQPRAPLPPQPGSGYR